MAPHALYYIYNCGLTVARFYPFLLPSAISLSAALDLARKCSSLNMGKANKPNVYHGNIDNNLTPSQRVSNRQQA